MLAILRFMKNRPQLRTWVALSGASCATIWITDPVGYVMIDFIAGMIVIARPAGIAQKAIGLLFACMIVFDFVYSLTPQADPDLFFGSLEVLGWFQWAILAGWAIHDRVEGFVRWNRVGDDPPLGVRKPVR